MNHWRVICSLLALAVVVLAAPGLAQANGLSLPDQPQAPLGTGFTYQGYLTDGEGPADGAYDFQFSLYSVEDGGSPLGTLTLGDQAVTGGYFTVLLDFGAGMFDGSARWLAIGVRGGAETGDYTPLDPRQALSAAPYAMYAPSAGAASTAAYAATSPWSGITGLPAGFADGVDNDTNTTYTAGSGLTLTGTEFNVVFGGYGTATTVARSDHTHTNYWRTLGNWQTDPATDFIGTGDETDLVFRVNNVQALRLVPILGVGQENYTPNIIGGYGGNSMTADIYGATISGGGWSGHENQVTGNYGAVGGGDLNAAGGYATVAGGHANTASNGYSTVAGGSGNTASSLYSAVVGGDGNEASGQYAMLGGGYQNAASGNYSAVLGGNQNTASGNYSAVLGGYQNTASGPTTTVLGGSQAAATHYGEMAYAIGSFETAGDAQLSFYMMRGTGIGTAWTSLSLGGYGYHLTLANDRIMAFDILIAGSTEAGESAGYRIQGLIERVGASTTLVGVPIVTTLGENDSAWDVQVLADNTNEALLVQVKGNGETIRWVASVQTVEVSWP